MVIILRNSLISDLWNSVNYYLIYYKMLYIYINISYTNIYIYIINTIIKLVDILI